MLVTTRAAGPLSRTTTSSPGSTTRDGVEASRGFGATGVSRGAPERTGAPSATGCGGRTGAAWAGAAWAGAGWTGAGWAGTVAAAAAGAGEAGAAAVLPAGVPLPAAAVAGLPLPDAAAARGGAGLSAAGRPCGRSEGW